MKKYSVLKIRSDHGIKFENHKFENFYSKNRINHNFLASIIPQQIGMVKRKNRTLIEMAWTILCESNLSKYF